MASAFESEVKTMGWDVGELKAYALRSPDGKIIVQICGAVVYVYDKEFDTNRPRVILSCADAEAATAQALRFGQGYNIATGGTNGT